MSRFKDLLSDRSTKNADAEKLLDRLMTKLEWSDCANEHDFCSCTSGIARYGAEPKWVYRNDSAFHCSNEVFKTDPSVGAAKTCQCKRITDRSGGGVADGPLLWSCGSPIPDGRRGPWSPDTNLVIAAKTMCSTPELAGVLDVYLDKRFQDNHKRWADESGWVEEAYVTYMAGKRYTNFEMMATNLIRSVSLFSTRPIVVVSFDKEFEPPASWLEFPNLIVYRMKPSADLYAMRRVSFNFNKIRAMIGARVIAGIQVDLDQVVFAGMDSFFRATRRESTEQYPYPVLPVHWMSRSGDPEDPYKAYAFEYSGHRSMRWNHAHPTWSYWALPFIAELLHERLTAMVPPNWMNEDEDMLNVKLWQLNVSKAWCKWDLEPGLYLENTQKDLYADHRYYPAGVPLLFFSAHNTKQVEDVDWLMTVMARCGEPSLRERAQCDSSDTNCNRHLARFEPSFMASSDEHAANVCCCLRPREEAPIFWEGKWYTEASQVPAFDSEGRERNCLMP